MDSTSLFIAMSLMEPYKEPTVQRYSQEEFIKKDDEYYAEMRKDFVGTDKEWEEFISFPY